MVTSQKPIQVTDDGFVVQVGGQDVEYLRLETAANLCGIHPQSLQRLYRNSANTDASRHGLKLGRTTYFSKDDLSRLGYSTSKQEGSN